MSCWLSESFHSYFYVSFGIIPSTEDQFRFLFYFLPLPLSIVPHQEWMDSPSYGDSNQTDRITRPSLGLERFHPTKSFIYSIYVATSNSFPSKLFSWRRIIRIYSSCDWTHSRCRKCWLWWRKSHLWWRKRSNQVKRGQAYALNGFIGPQNPDFDLYKSVIWCKRILHHVIGALFYLTSSILGYFKLLTWLFCRGCHFIWYKLLWNVRSATSQSERRSHRLQITRCYR